LIEGALSLTPLWGSYFGQRLRRSFEKGLAITSERHLVVNSHSQTEGHSTLAACVTEGVLWREYHQGSLVCIGKKRCSLPVQCAAAEIEPGGCPADLQAGNLW